MCLGMLAGRDESKSDPKTSDICESNSLSLPSAWICESKASSTFTQSLSVLFY